MTTTNSQTAEDLVAQWVTGFNADRGTRLSDLCAPDVVVHAASLDNNSAEGLDKIAQLLGVYRSAFPEGRFSVTRVYPSDDQIWCEWAAQGVHTGEFLELPPTHKAATIDGVCKCRLVDGRIAELWFEVDMYALLDQIGAVLWEPGLRSPAAERVAREAAHGLVAYLTGGTALPEALFGADMLVHAQCFNLRVSDRGPWALETVRGYVSSVLPDVRITLEDAGGQGNTVVCRGRLGSSGDRATSYRLYCMFRIERDHVAELWVRTGRVCHDNH